jgi:hypothetical protein
MSPKSTNYHEWPSKSCNQLSSITGSISLHQMTTSASRYISNPTSKCGPTIKKKNINIYIYIYNICFIGEKNIAEVNDLMSNNTHDTHIIV